MFFPKNIFEALLIVTQLVRNYPELIFEISTKSPSLCHIASFFSHIDYLCSFFSPFGLLPTSFYHLTRLREKERKLPYMEVVRNYLFLSLLSVY